MRPDVIVCWPPDCDYPLWRRFLADNRKRFGEVFVMFTATTQHGPRMDEWLVNETNLPDIWFLWVQSGNDDWRDYAVNAALRPSRADWVWFTEQDFLITDPETFWSLVDASDADVIGWRDEVPRWHPSSLFVRRETIDRTRRYFGPVPGDHFRSFSDDLDAVADRFQVLDPRTYEHLQGLTEAQHLLLEGKPIMFKPERFQQYLRDSLMAGVPLEPRWKERAEQALGVFA